uniref:Ig-like domain-containing protein n=1 Tax=Angiostrongylus costaricensis TaxID=334426 RepID=A0A158PK24_ANGCS
LRTYRFACLAFECNGNIVKRTRITRFRTHLFNATILPALADSQRKQDQRSLIATFVCRARGVPRPEITWFYEGSVIPHIKGRFLVSDDGAELTISKVTRQDEGVYSCLAGNSVGAMMADAKLSVDTFIDDATLKTIATQARDNVDRAVDSTRLQLSQERVSDPEDLKRLFRFSIPARAVELSKARDIYEESVRLVQEHIQRGLHLPVDKLTPNVSYEAVLAPSHVQTLMELSGCQTGQFKTACTDMCFHSKYRSYDGQCNNFEHPMWGVSQMPLLRLLPPIYENGFSTPVGWEHGRLYYGYPKPNPREVSRLLVRTKSITPHSYLSAMVMQWGQFVDHDLTHTATALSRQSYASGAICNRTCANLDPCFNIPLPPNDSKLHTGIHSKYPCIEFERSGAVCGSGETSLIFQRVTYRDQMNIITSYLDGSAVYGSTEVQALELRDLFGDHGQMRFDIVSMNQKPYLPFEKDSDMDCRRNFSQENPIRCFLAGDLRANEQLGLTALHTIFLREHNRIAAHLLEMNVNWDGETIFQGFESLKKRRTCTTVHVSTVLLSRFGHTLINPTLFRLDNDFRMVKDGHIPLHEAFFAPERLLSEGGIDPLIRGLFASSLKLPKPDQLLNMELTEKLFHRFHEVALDLAVMNIQRGRDHGLPGYTEYRRFCNLSVPATWDELGTDIPDATVRSKLKGLYGDPRNIDLWVGGIVEQRLPDALMGPTFACIIGDQFRRLRDGDRFWYENEGVFTKLQLQQIKKVSLARLFCDNGDNIDRVQRNVFFYPGNSTKHYGKCENIPEVNLNMWMNCCDSSCAVSTTHRSVSLLVHGITTRRYAPYFSIHIKRIFLCICSKNKIFEDGSLLYSNNNSNPYIMLRYLQNSGPQVSAVRIELVITLS